MKIKNPVKTARETVDRMSTAVITAITLSILAIATALMALGVSRAHSR